MNSDNVKPLDYQNRESESQQIEFTPSSKSGTVLRLLVWFIPIGIINAFFSGLALASLCFLFCTTTQIESIFILLGFGFTVLSLILVPVIVVKKIASRDASLRRRSILFNILIGYFIVFAITMVWAQIGGSYPEGWKPSINERIVEWVQVTAGNIKDKQRNSALQQKYTNESFQFTPISSDVKLVNSHDAVLSLTGTLSGLSRLDDNQYNLIISSANVGNVIAEDSEAKKLKGKSFALGSELWTGTVNNNSDVQTITISAVLPKEFAQIVKSNPASVSKIKLELLSLSPHAYQHFNFTSIWQQEVESTPKYLGSYLQDNEREINYKLPEQAIKYTRIENNEFITEPNNNVSFSVTLDPKQALCCEVPQLRVSQAGNGMSVDEYLSKVPWRNEIIRKQVTKPGSFQLGIVEARPTIASPYKAIIYSRYGEVAVYELTGRNSGLDELYQLYVEYYKKIFPEEKL
jgi:hypothetical protein